PIQIHQHAPGSGSISRRIDLSVEGPEIETIRITWIDHQTPYVSARRACKSPFRRIRGARGCHIRRGDSSRYATGTLKQQGEADYQYEYNCDRNSFHCFRSFSKTELSKVSVQGAPGSDALYRSS